MKKTAILTAWIAVVLAGSMLISTVRAAIDYPAYLPIVYLGPTLTPLPSKTPTPTATSPPTGVPTPTKTPTPQPSGTGNIDITNIFYNGAGSQEPNEYVEFKNIDNHPIQLQGWKLSDIANHVYTFPSFVIQPGQVCRVYTNQVQPAWCSFSYGSGSAIWNNSGDCATLKNASNQQVDQYCY